MALAKQLTQDLIQAMKNHDKESLSVIRMLKSELTNKKVELGHDLSEDEELLVVSKAVKQHKESIDEFKKGNRDDLVQQQENELKVLSKYAPQPLSEEDLQNVVAQTIQDTNSSGMNDFGKVMGNVMSKVKGKADGSTVQKIVRNQLK